MRCESSALEAYGQAIAALVASPIPRLDVNCTSHARRIRELSAFIREGGGAPDATSEEWGDITGAMAVGGTLCARHAILALLARGEAQVLEDLAAARGHGDAQCRESTDADLIPSQERAYQRVLSL